MTNLKKLAVLGAVILAVGSTSVMAFAASNPAVPAEYESIEEFKTTMLENKIAILNERVAAGILTQEEADEIIKALEENQLTCDGTGEARIGQSYGAAFGGMMGRGQGFGGQGGNGFGNGLGLRDGSCLVQ